MTYLIGAVVPVIFIRIIFRQDIIYTVKTFNTVSHVFIDVISTALFVSDPLNPFGLKRFLAFVSLAFVGPAVVYGYHRLVEKNS